MTLRQYITSEQPQADKTHLTEYQAEQKRQVTETIDSRELRPGLKMYEWDVNAETIQPATIKEETVLVGRMKSYSGYVEFYKRAGCYYHPALNAENAERHFKKKVKFKGGKTIKQLEDANN